MVNITIAVPDELKKKMDQRPEMNWSELARRAWKKQLDVLDWMDELTKDVNISDEEILEISRKINRRIAKRSDDELKRWTGSQNKSNKSTVE